VEGKNKRSCNEPTAARWTEPPRNRQLKELGEIFGVPVGKFWIQKGSDNQRSFFTLVSSSRKRQPSFLLNKVIVIGGSQKLLYCLKLLKILKICWRIYNE
jgi:hypothetical protein